MKFILPGLGLATVLAIGVFALACGNDNNVTTPTPSPTPIPAPEPPPTPSPTPTPSPGQPTAGQTVSFMAKINAVDPPDLMVTGGWAVTTDASTVITRDGVPIPLTGLETGASVRIKGVVLGDAIGTVLAKRITWDTNGDGV
jgi:hypothetical protein